MLNSKILTENYITIHDLCRFSKHSSTYLNIIESKIQMSFILTSIKNMLLVVMVIN